MFLVGRYLSHLVLYHGNVKSAGMHFLFEVSSTGLGQKQKGFD